MKKLFTLIAACTLFANVQAAHIIGGDFSVQHVSGNTFRAILTLYRDCGSGGADFDATVDITVFDNVTNQQLMDLNFQFVGFDAVEAELGNSCFTPNVCMEIGTYEADFELTDNPNGYYLTKERCCRNTLSVNLAIPDVGFVFTLDFPDAAIQNSSPLFNPFPTEAFLCVNATSVIDFGATDVDGDSLVYSFTEPLQGASTNFDPNPAVASAKPYAAAPWAVDYSTDNQIGGPIAMTIDSQTGVIEGQPTAIGFFTIAVKVEEYRDGVKIGEIRREIQLESSACDVDVPSTITTEDGMLEYEIYANTEFCIDITATDVNEGDILFLSADGELFDGSIVPMANFETVNGESTVTQTFCWSPLCTNVSDDPYLVTFTAFSEGCAPEILVTTLDILITVILDDDEPTDITGPIPDGGTTPGAIIDLYDPTTHCFDFEFTDPNVADSLFVRASSEILGFDSVTMEEYEIDQGTISIPFCWDVVCADVQDEPYLVDFQVIAINCEVNDTTFYTVPITVIVQDNEPTTFIQPVQEIFWEYYSQETFCFPVIVTDGNYFDTLQVTADSEIFLRPSAPVFDTLNGNSAVEGELCWTPECSDVREAPYQVIFKATANSCKTDDVVLYPVEIYLTLPPENGAEFTLPEEGLYIEHFIGDEIILVDVFGSDPDPYDTLSLSAVSRAMTADGSPASFESMKSVTAVVGEFEWNPNCLDVDSEVYPVTFILTSSSCQKVNQIERTINVFVTTPTLGNIEPIPNVITPNGDGKNEEWTIEDKNDPCLIGFNSKIYDRWGKEVFVTSDPSFYWDAKYASGNTAEQGQYFYIIEFTYIDQKVSHSGNIQILK